GSTGVGRGRGAAGVAATRPTAPAAPADPTSTNNSSTVNTNVTATGAISGTVTQGAGGASPGTGIGGALVRVYTPAGFTVASVTTAADGTYTASGLAPGSYKVSAEANNFAAQFFNARANLTAADLVAVAGRATTTHTEFALPA